MLIKLNLFLIVGIFPVTKNIRRKYKFWLTACENNYKKIK